MPTLTAARGGHKRGSSQRSADFDAVWEIGQPGNVSHNGQGLYCYIGDGGSQEEDIGTIRTLRPLNPGGGGLSSFEIKIVDTGKSNYIAVGVCDGAYPKNLLPGWEKTSIAFHTDEGSLFNSSDDEEPLNQPCKKDDTVKCVLVASQELPGRAAVEFYRNDRIVAEISTEVPPGGFYGVIGMMSKEEKIQLSPPTILKRTEFSQIWEVSTPSTIDHHGNGICSYTGAGDYGEDSIGTVRGKYPIDPLGPLHRRSFELFILDPGENKYIAIGICSEAYPKNLLPGWEETSVGYHADNGNLFHSCGDGQPTEHPCKKGDVMRCTVEPVDGSPKRVKVLFHRNGYQVGQVTAWAPERGFYACFGMMSREEKVQVILPDVSLPYAPPKKQFHDVWEISSPDLKHQESGICTYVGAGGSDHVATIRSKAPLAPLSPNNTFDIKIVDPGEQCFIALGVCSKSCCPAKLPGWEENSVGFHADNGLIMQSSLGEQQTSHPCRQGDVVRCTLEPVDNSDKRVSVVFHRNGTYVGKANVWIPAEGLYAQVGAMGRGEVFQVASPLMEPAFLRHESTASLNPSLMSLGSMSQPMKQKYPPTGVKDDHPQVEKEQERYMERPPDDSAGMAARMEAERHSMYAHYPGHHPFFHPYMRAPPPYWRARAPPHHHHPSHHFHPYFSAYGMPSHPAHMPPFHSPGNPPSVPYYSPVAHPDADPAITPLASHPHPKQTGAPPWDPHASSPYPYAGGRHRSASTPTGGPPPSSATETPPTPFDPSLKSSPVYAMQASVASAASESAAAYQSQFSADSSTAYDPIGQPDTSLSSFVTVSEEPGDASTGLKTGISSVYDSQFSYASQAGTGTIAQSGQTSTRSDGDEPTDSEGDVSTEKGEVSHVRFRSPSPTPPLEATPQLAKLDPQKFNKADLLQEQVSMDYPDSPVTVVADSKVIATKVEANIALESSPAFTLTDTVRPTMELEQAEVELIPKEVNKTFQILQNVQSDEDGSFECTTPIQSPELAFLMCRLPVTEKIPYFEVEIQHVAEGGNIAAGLVWNHYPTTVLPGMLRGSIAFHSSKGTVCTGKPDSRQVTTRCISGDIVGCKINLKYKSETASPGHEGNVDVEFFKNGISVGTDSVPLPSSGFHPAVGLYGTGTKVKLNYGISVTQEGYFENHPLPETYRNFTTGPSLLAGWNCIWNSKIEEEKYVSLLESHRGQPAVIQSRLPFSSVTPYFEVELLHPMSLFSVLSVGVLPKTHSESTQTVPGEASNSIGFLPLLGFVMRNGAIASSIPDEVSYGDKITLGVGINFNAKAMLSPSSSTSSCDEKISVFFTVNGQQISCTMTTLQRGGVFPTLALDCSSKISDQQLVAVQFPKRSPAVNGLPLGLARGAMDDFEVLGSACLLDVRGFEASPEESSVRAVQAAFPLSPSHTYYELRVLGGGVNYSISCGLASFNYPLNIHPGKGKDSIALIVGDGNVVHNSEREVVVAPCRYKGAVIGCGARFPEDGSSNYAEVFFTINQKMITHKLVSVPSLGLFPTVGLKTSGALVKLDINTPDPFPDLLFNTSWDLLENVRAEGSEIRLIKSAEMGTAQLVVAVSQGKTVYFEMTPLTEPNGKICMCLSTTRMCLSGQTSQEDRFLSLDIVTGSVFARDQFSLRREMCSFVDKGGHRRFGWGLQPHPTSCDLSLLFFTVDRQVVYCVEMDICSCHKKLYPYIFLKNCTTTISVDACASWPPVTPIGKGWGRYANLTRENSMIVHSSPNRIKPCGKIPVGFAQTAMPLVPTNAYFEVEVCSRATNKAIAVGVAPRTYPSNSWVGWKKGSAAYHLDDGKLFKGISAYGQTMGPKVFAGSTVGCGITFTSDDHAIAIKGGEQVKSEVFFTINGTVVGTHEMPVPPGGLFPTICLEAPTESVIFHSRSHFPPVANSVGSEWATAYSIHQTERVLEHSCKHQAHQGSIPISKPMCQTKLPFSSHFDQGFQGGIKPPRAFCQAKQPFSSETPYFEVEIRSLSNLSQIAGGAAALIAKGSTAVNTDSMMYSCSGQLVTRKGSVKSTGGTQKCGVGDILGCAVIFTDNQPTSIEFYLNGMKVLHLNLAEKWREQSLYPTIVLTHPGDAVIPSLHLALPKWDPSSLVGWLRSERVKLRNNILEYSGTGSSTSDVGVAQVSQPLQLDSISYYEIEVLDPGAKCTIAIGAATPDYPLNRQPGWSSNSIAYHGDDGCLFQACGTGVCFGPKWKIRDTVGLGIRPLAGQGADAEPAEVQVYFTRNGKEVGHTTVALPPNGLFPTVGLHSAHEKVKVYFGPSSSPDHCRLAWGTLCGLKVSRSHDGRGQIVEYRDNGRRTPNCGIRLALGVGSQPFSESMQYFEVKVLSFGHLKAMAVGVVPKGYSLECVPGWAEGSIAYHTDNGELYSCSGQGKVFGPVARRGDVIGCGVSLTPASPKHCSLFFTYNGMEIGRMRAAVPESGLYPAVCLTSKKDRISVHFLEAFKPRRPQSELNFVGLMRIHNCSYSDQIITFSGSGDSGYSQAPAMAQFSIPLHDTHNYFLTNLIKSSDAVLIGVAVRDYPMKYAPGYTSISVAYDIIKGNIRAVFSGDSFHNLEAPKCKIGDTVGCGIVTETIDPKTARNYVFFTKNGTMVKKIEMVGVFEDLYPIVGIIPNGRSSALFMDWNTPVFEPQNVL